MNEPTTHNLRPTVHNAKVSIIMPVYNAAPFLAAAIDSVLAQEGVKWELVAVNDGSSDGSDAILADYLDRFPETIRVLDLAENVGQSAALNCGIAAAQGDFVKFLDADDLLSPGHLAAQVKSFEGTTRHLSACRWASFRESPAGALPREEYSARDYDDPLAWILDSLDHDEGMMPGWRWLIPRAVLEKAGGWDERLSLNNDFEFSIRLLLASEGVRQEPEALLFYRQGQSATLSKHVSRKALESAWLTTRLGCDRIVAREDGARARRLCADRMQDWLFRFYPQHPDLAAEAEAAVAALGGSDRRIQGGKMLRALSRLLSWKAARRLQASTERLGWSRVQAWKAEQREPHF